MFFYFKFKYFNPKEIKNDNDINFDPSNFFDFLQINILSTLNNKRNDDKEGGLKLCERKDFEAFNFEYLFDIYKKNGEALICQNDTNLIL